jgi:hypothetical protein
MLINVFLTFMLFFVVTIMIAATMKDTPPFWVKVIVVSMLVSNLIAVFIQILMLIWTL